MTNRADDKTWNASNPLNFVRTGMAVYDLSEKQIGVVETVFLGELGDEAILNRGPAATSPDVDLNRPGALTGNFTHLYDPGSDLPEELQERLLHDGYVRVNIQGLLGLSRLVFADQIAYVSDEGLVLKVYEDDLLKV